MRKIILFIFVTIFFLSSAIFAQVDNIDSVKTLINIGDSSTYTDSVKIGASKKYNLFSPFNFQKEKFLSTYLITKKEIDFENYRNSFDILSLLPSVSQSSFGLIGQPNEAILYNQKNKNFSLAVNNFLFLNKWNGFTDFNLLQSENISSLEILPLSRGFLLGTNSSSAIINLNTKDSITTKSLTRIRYYQAPHDEGFIDAMFSARVLNNLSLFFRLSNATFANENNSGIYKNSEYGVWQLNLKSIYKFSDNLFANINYIHHKSNTELNGGIDLATLTNNSVSLKDGLFNNLSPVNFIDRNKTIKVNKVSTEFYGNIFSNSFTKLNFTYDFTEDLFKQYLTDTLTNGTKINNINKYSNLSTTLTHEQSIKKLFLKLSFGIDITDYKIDQINYDGKKNSSFFSALAEYSFVDSLIIPAAFFKIANYENQKTEGFGFDLKLKLNDHFKLMSGFSYFNRPYLLTEIQSLPNNINKNFIANIFAALEVINNFAKSSITYYRISANNSPVPIFNNDEQQLGSTVIIFPFTEKTKSEGINLFSIIKFWKLETFFNGNYILSNTQSLIPSNGKYNLSAGIYYRDILFDNNLNLKTGFNIFYSDNIDYQIYDFQNMSSSGYYLSGNSVKAFTPFSISNLAYRLDFTLAGRIQDRATFYFAYENITGNNYYSIPYYPIPIGGIKIGITWDFIN